MPRVLLTAYGPYDDWDSNASWLVLEALTRELPPNLEVVTRLYPVNFDELATRLASDLTAETAVAIHMGQSPGVGRIGLEAVGLNLALERNQRPEDARPLAENGPPAYFSDLPLAAWAQKLRSEGIPTEVSHHAGTYLCNAAHYLAHHLAAERGLPTMATFLHLPLDPSQVVGRQADYPSLPAEVSAHGVRLILDDIAARA